MTQQRAPFLRKSVRLPAFDYASNATYFVTICTLNRESLFGDIAGDQMRLNALGTIVEEELCYFAELRAELEHHHMVVMPNHLHGLQTITPAERSSPNASPIENIPETPDRGKLVRPPRSLGSFVAGFKSPATKRINEEQALPGIPVWQRNYYEHTVRSEASFQWIWDYIEHNPAR